MKKGVISYFKDIVKCIALKLNVLITYILLSLTYGFVVGGTALIAFIKRKKFLDLSKEELPSYWIDSKPVSKKLEDYKHMF